MTVLTAFEMRLIFQGKKLTVVGLACNNCSFLNFMYYKTYIFGGM